MWPFAKQHDPAPWDGAIPILRHLQQHMADVGLSDSVDPLPDEKVEPGGLRWAPGALDGVMGRHFSQAERPDLVNDLVAAITSWTRRPSEGRLAIVYRLAQDEGLVAGIDALFQKLATRSGGREGNANLGRWLVANSAHRGPLKLGIVMLGLAGDLSDRDVLLQLGRHEEFTLFSADALGRLSTDWVMELWELAKHVRGWGRIHLVERLCQQRDPRLNDWLVRTGYHNSVMDEYLAVPCAEAGDLHLLLGADRIDDDLMNSTAGLLSAMITGGPARDITDYAHASQVVCRYLDHIAQRDEPALNHLLTINLIQSYLSANGSTWATRYEQGWTPESAQRCRQHVATLIALPHWEPLARQDFDADDHERFWIAMRVLDILKVDTFELHWRRLGAKPTESSRWYQAVSRCTPQTIGQVVAYAEEIIPLDVVAQPNAAISAALLPGGWYDCLDFVLQELRAYPGVGWKLLDTGLKSPALRNRNMALMALSAWGRSAWPLEAESALREAAGRELDERVRLNLERVLAGEKPA